MRNNFKLDLINISTYILFGENRSIYSQVIEQKQNYDGRTNERTDRMTDNPNPI